MIDLFNWLNIDVLISNFIIKIMGMKKVVFVLLVFMWY